ncbi:MAG TPA: copper uptake system-associated protein [Chroococcidiopsis sp.]
MSTSVINSLSFPGMPADANLRVSHVAIVEDYAIADWRLGDGGGQELLHSNNGVWVVVTGGGGAMDTSDLIQAGVPKAIAMALIQQIQAQWQQ